MKTILKERIPMIFDTDGGMDINCWELYKKIFKCRNSPYLQCGYKSWLYNKITQYKFTYGKDFTYKLRKRDRYLQENEIEKINIDWKAYKKIEKHKERNKKHYKNKEKYRC